MSTATRTEITFRASKSNLCEVCCTGTKDCSATADALHFCRGEPADPAAWKLVKRGDIFHCYRRVDDKRHLNENLLLNGKPHNDPKPIIGGKAKGKSKPHPKLNAEKGKPQTWREQVKKFYHDANNKDGRQCIAANLSLPVEAFGGDLPVPGCGYTEYGLKDETNPKPEWVGATTFPMVDGNLEPCGVLKRLDRPVISLKIFGSDDPKNKFSMGGGHGGLILGRDWSTRHGPLLCPEGGSDVFALAMCGLPAIARPSNVVGAELLAEVLRDEPPDRMIVVLGENDEKLDGKWPGKEGVVAVAPKLATLLNRPVHYAYPPDGIKDCRVWVQELLAGQADALDMASIGDTIRKHIEATAIPVEPSLEDIAGGDESGDGKVATSPTFAIGDRVAASDRGNVGTVIEVLARDQYKVKFVGENGIAEKVFHADSLKPEASKHAAGTKAPGETGELVVESLEGLRPLPVRYLVPDRIPAGMLGLLAGEGGHGKSVTTLELAAALTTGRCAFGLTYPNPVLGKALIVSCEDDWERTIIPRLAVFGADLSRVLRIRGVKMKADGQTLDFHLGHFAELEKLLKADPEIRLVVIDPAGAYIGRAGVNESRDSDLRAILGPLSEAANATGAAILLVKHLNKSANVSAVQRVSGSTGYVNAVRFAYLIAPDTEDPKRKHLHPMKANVLPAGQDGLAYRLESLPPDEARKVLLTRWPDLASEDLEALALQLFRQSWEAGGSVNVDDLANGNSKRAAKSEDVPRCIEFITKFLGDYSFPDAELSTAFEKAGLSFNAFKRAKATLRDSDRTNPARLSSKPRGEGGPWWCWIGPQSYPRPDRPDAAEGLARYADAP